MLQQKQRTPRRSTTRVPLLAEEDSSCQNHNLKPVRDELFSRPSRSYKLQGNVQEMKEMKLIIWMQNKWVKKDEFWELVKGMSHEMGGPLKERTNFAIYEKVWPYKARNKLNCHLKKKAKEKKNSTAIFFHLLSNQNGLCFHTFLNLLLTTSH